MSNLLGKKKHKSISRRRRCACFLGCVVLLSHAYGLYAEAGEEEDAAALEEESAVRGDYIAEAWKALPSQTELSYADSYHALGAADTEIESDVSSVSPRADASYKDTAYPYAHDEAWLTYFQTTFPPSRDQGEYGTSWAHAAIGLSEFYLVAHGRADRTIDLSELGLAYGAYMQKSASPALCESGDSVRFTATAEVEHVLNNGGNLLYAAQELYQRGMVMESRLPYSEAEKAAKEGLDAAAELSADYYLKDALRISLADNTMQVKGAILCNGAVGASMNADRANYSVSNNSYYSAAKEEDIKAKRAVMIVGWDDDFPAECFAAEDASRPSQNGAWLVRNSESEGSKAAYESYFWLSYESSGLDGAWVYCISDERYDNRYGYDSQIHNQGGYFDPASGIYGYANVFTVGGEKAASRESLRAVGFELSKVASGGSGFTVKIYTDLDGTKPSSGTEIPTATTKGFVYHAGSYTVSLNKPVTLVRGKKYAVVLLFDEPGSTVAIEYGNISCNACEIKVGILYGQSFYSSSPNVWAEQKGSNESFGNLVLWGMTNDLEDDHAVAGMSVEPSNCEISGEDEMQLTAQIWGDGGESFPAEGKVRFESNRPEIVRVNAEDGSLYPVSNGTAVVSAKYLDYTAYARVKVHGMTLKAPSLWLDGEEVLAKGLKLDCQKELRLSSGDEQAAIYYSLGEEGKTATEQLYSDEHPIIPEDAFAGKRLVLLAYASREGLDLPGEELKVYIDVRKGDAAESSALDMHMGSVSQGETIYMVRGQHINIGSGDWMSDGAAVGINKKGELTAKKAGSARVSLKGEADRGYDIVVTAPLMEPKSLTLAVGDTRSMRLDLIEEEYAEKYADQLWYSSNPEVATVDDQGVVRAVSKGSAIISAYVCGVEIKGKVTVKDVIAPKKLQAEDEVCLNAMQSFVLNIEGIKNKNIVWDTEVLSVSKNASGKIGYYENDIVRITPGGKLTAIGAGTSILSGHDATDQDKKIKLSVTVRKPQPRSLYLAPKASRSISPYLVNRKQALWETEGAQDMLTLNAAAGKIKIQKDGECTLRCYYNPAKPDEPKEGFCYEIHVYSYEPVFATDEKLVYNKKQYQLAMTIGDENETDMYELGFDGVNYETALFKSSKSAVAFVDEYGRIYARAPGKAVISTKIHKKTIKLTVTVSKREGS